MAAVPQGAVSTAAAPLLDIWTSDGRLIDPPDDGTLTFVIFDLSTEEKEGSPAQVFPVSGVHTVDLTADKVGGQEAHYAAVFTLSGSEPLGAHEIRWAWEMDGVAFSYVQRFDVLAAVPRGLGGGYELVSTFRAEGIGKSQVSDIRLLKLILEQSAFIDQVTRRFFEPRYLSLPIDGSSSRHLLVEHPIIALDTVMILDEVLDIDPANRGLVIYNRHIAGMVEPDDRTVPQIEIPEVISYLGSADNWHVSQWQFGPRNFAKSAQNVTVAGLFGYTDQDGSPIGKTPDGIRRATRLLVARNLPKLGCPEDAFDARMANRVTSMRTRDQSITFSDKGLGEGGFTTDIEIDTLLAMYRRPMGIAST